MVADSRSDAVLARPEKDTGTAHLGVVTRRKKHSDMAIAKTETVSSLYGTKLVGVVDADGWRDGHLKHTGGQWWRSE